MTKLLNVKVRKVVIGVVMLCALAVGAFANNSQDYKQTILNTDRITDKSLVKN